MSDAVLDGLRADVRRHTGPARARPLVTLAQVLADRYWQAGPGQPAALPYLDEAISAFDEAYPLLEAGSHMRSQVAAQFGWLLGIRHLTHHQDPQDRERGIPLLEEARTMTEPGIVQVSMTRLVLGQLYLSRVTGRLRDQNALMAAMTGAAPAAEVSDIDRAAVAFREISDDHAALPEMKRVATAMLQVTDTLRTLLGGFGGPMGFDFTKMMQAMSSLQNLQTAMPSAGMQLGGLPNLFGADAMAKAPPLDRPSVVIDMPQRSPAAPETAPATPTARPQRAHPPSPQRHPMPPPTAPPPATTTAARAGADELRSAFHKKLPGSDPDAIRALLDPQAPPLRVPVVDDLVALSSAIVEAPDAEQTDHLLFAVALYLRSRADDGGWGLAGSTEDDTDDVHAAADALLRAAPGLTSADTATVGLAFTLAGLLDERAPRRGARDGLADAFTGVSAALRQLGAQALAYPYGHGLLFVDAATGRFTSTASATASPARVFAVGDAPLPLGATVSHVRSGAQLVTLAGRTRRPLTVKPVFVANPRGDRPQAGFDALMLRRTFYPHAIGLGETIENSEGKGTPDDVRAVLDASLLHLGCGVAAEGALQLAGPALLDCSYIAAGPPAAEGGLAVLPPTVAGTAALVDALLATRFCGAVVLREPLADPVASLVYAILHAELVDKRLAPAEAVRATRAWLADPRRPLPDHLAGPYGAYKDESCDPTTIIHYGV